MAKHFISMLGTSLYEPCVYTENMDDENQSVQEFVQLATIAKYRDAFKEDGSKITICVTEHGSYEANYLDREYTEKDNASRWVYHGKKEVMAGKLKKGLRTQFCEQFPELKEKLECLVIPSGNNNEEIWEIFDRIFSGINENDEIIFDITHGFRSLPMLFMTIINYAKVLKNCKLVGIHYGAFEASKIVGDRKLVPLMNLTVFNEIIDWSFAAQVFMKYGNAEMMQTVFAEKFNSIPNSEKKDWRGVKNTIDSAVALSDAIQTARGVKAEDIGVKSKNFEVSIMSAYQSFDGWANDEKNEKIREIKPLVPLFEKASKEYEVFNKDDNYEIAFSVVEWCIKNGMIQQGYTALEEGIKTYFCAYYGLNQVNETDRDIVVGRSFTSLAHSKQNGYEIETMEDRLAYLTIVSKDDDPKIWNDPSRVFARESIFKYADTKLFTLINKIKDERNDINHFGMRDKALGSSKLKTKLKSNFEEWKVYFDAIQNGELMLK